MSTITTSRRKVLNKLTHLFEDVLKHDGYGEIRIEVRLLRRGQKEVVLYCGKQYRFVIDSREIDEPYGEKTHNVAVRSLLEVED